MVYVDSDSDYTDEETEEECPDCGKAFLDMNKLVEHFDNVHQKNKKSSADLTGSDSGSQTSNLKEEPRTQIENVSEKVLPPVSDKMPTTKYDKVNSETSVNSEKQSPVKTCSPVQSKENISPVLNKQSEESSLTFEDLLARYLQENNLPFMPRFTNTSGGNSWYEAISDQIVLHNIPSVARDHTSVRKAVCDSLLTLPQAKAWVKNLFGGKKKKYLGFVDKHRKEGESTDAKGLICQATALFLKRTIHIVGTANMKQKVCYTKLESVPEADKLPPLNVGYFQDNYQSLDKMQVEESVKTDKVIKDKDESLTNKIVGKAPRVPIASKPLRRKRVAPKDDEEDDEDEEAAKREEMVKNKIDRILKTAVSKPAPAPENVVNQENKSISSVPRNVTNPNNVQQTKPVTLQPYNIQKLEPLKPNQQNIQQRKISKVEPYNGVVHPYSGLKITSTPAPPPVTLQTSGPSMASLLSLNNINPANVQQAKSNMPSVNNQNQMRPNLYSVNNQNQNMSNLPTANTQNQNRNMLNHPSSNHQNMMRPNFPSLNTQNKMNIRPNMPPLNSQHQMNIRQNLPSVHPQNQMNIRKNMPSLNTQNQMNMRQNLPSLNNQNQMNMRQNLPSLNTQNQMNMRQNLPSVHPQNQMNIKQNLPPVHPQNQMKPINMRPNFRSVTPQSHMNIRTNLPSVAGQNQQYLGPNHQNQINVRANFPSASLQNQINMRANLPSATPQNYINMRPSIAPQNQMNIQPNLTSATDQTQINMGPTLPSMTPQNRVNLRPTLSTHPPQNQINVRQTLPSVTPQNQMNLRPTLPILPSQNQMNMRPRLPSVTTQNQMNMRPILPTHSPQNRINMRPNLTSVAPQNQMNMRPTLPTVTPQNQMNVIPSLPSVTTQNQMNMRPTLPTVTPQNQMNVRPSLPSVTTQNQMNMRPTLPTYPPQNQMNVRQTFPSVAPQNQSNMRPTLPTVTSQNPMNLRPTLPSVTPQTPMNMKPTTNPQLQRPLLATITPQNQINIIPRLPSVSSQNQRNMRPNTEDITRANMPQQKNAALGKIPRNVVGKEKNVIPQTTNHSKMSSQKAPTQSQMSVMARRRLINNAAITIQRWFRHVHKGLLARKLFIRRRDAARKIQKFWRSYFARKKRAAFVLKRRNTSAAIIQRWFRHSQRGRVDRKNFLRKKQAAGRIQSLWKSVFYRRRAAKTKAAIIIQNKLRTNYLRKRFVKKRAAASSIQKFFRMTRKGRMYRKEFLRKRKAAMILQVHCRRWLATCNAPAFQMVPPREECVDQDSGDLEAVNTYRINPETGDLEMDPISLEDYVDKVNSFLDFKRLSNMSVKSWKKSKLRKAEEGRFQRQSPQEIRATEFDAEDEINVNGVEDEMDGNKFNVSIKPPIEFESVGQQKTEIKWNKPEIVKQDFFGVLTETSHWKLPFETLEHVEKIFVDNGEEEDFCDKPEPVEDFVLNATTNHSFEQNNANKNVEYVLDLILESIAPPSFRGIQFNDWQKHGNQSDKTSWLEKNIEAKRVSIKTKAAITIQSYWRSFQQKKLFNRNKNAAAKIQKWLRHIQTGRRQRTLFLNQKRAVLTIQSQWRGMIARRTVEKQRMADFIINDLLNSVAAREKVVLALQCRYRGMVARKTYEKLRITKCVLNDLIDGAVAPRNAAQDTLDNMISGIFPSSQEKTNKEKSNSLVEEFLRRFPDKDPKKKKRDAGTKSTAVGKAGKSSQLEEFFRLFPEKDPKNRKKTEGVKRPYDNIMDTKNKEESSKKNLQLAKRTRKATTKEQTIEKKTDENVSITLVSKESKVESDDIFILEEKIIKNGGKKVCNKVGCKAGNKRPIKDFIDIAESGDEDDDEDVLIVDAHDSLKKKAKIETKYFTQNEIKPEETIEDPIKIEKKTVKNIVINDEDLDNLYGESFVPAKPIKKDSSDSKATTIQSNNNEMKFSVKKENFASDVNTSTISITKVPVPDRRVRSKTGIARPPPPSPPSEDDFEPPQVSVRRTTRASIVSGVVRPHENMDRGPVCSKCRQVCKDKSNLRNHFLSHFYDRFEIMIAENKPFACTQGSCANVARDKITAIRHVAFTHRKLQEVTGMAEEAMMIT